MAGSQPCQAGSAPQLPATRTARRMRRHDWTGRYPGGRVRCQAAEPAGLTTVDLTYGIASVAGALLLAWLALYRRRRRCCAATHPARGWPWPAAGSIAAWSTIA
jgi:hypothetical protein